MFVLNFHTKIKGAVCHEIIQNSNVGNDLQIGFRVQR